MERLRIFRWVRNVLRERVSVMQVDDLPLVSFAIKLSLWAYVPDSIGRVDCEFLSFPPNQKSFQDKKALTRFASFSSLVRVQTCASTTNLSYTSQSPALRSLVSLDAWHFMQRELQALARFRDRMTSWVPIDHKRSGGAHQFPFQFSACRIL